MILKNVNNHTKMSLFVVVLIGKNKEDLKENQICLDQFKTYPATLKTTSGRGLL